MEKKTLTSPFPNMTSSSFFFDVALFLLSSVVTGPSFMSVSWLVLELWQFLHIRYWPEFWELEIPLSEFCSISRDGGKLETPHLAWVSLMKSNWILQNCEDFSFDVFWVIIGRSFRKNAKDFLSWWKWRVCFYWKLTFSHVLFWVLFNSRS